MLNVEKIVFINRVFYSCFDIIADNANVARPRRRLVTRGKINRTVSNVFLHSRLNVLHPVGRQRLRNLRDYYFKAVFETKHRRAVVGRRYD